MNRRLTLPMAAAALLILAACNNVTPEKYEQVRSGMTRDEVHAILGKPDDISGGGIGKLSLDTETWNGRKHRITITFANDKVSLKSIQPLQEQ